MAVPHLAKIFAICSDLSTVDRTTVNLSDLKARFDHNSIVRVISTSEYKQAAFALAEAFAEDDVSRYFIDTPSRAHWSSKQKWDLHLKIMEYITYAHCMNGLVLCAGDDYGCVALWYGSRHNISPPPQPANLSNQDASRTEHG